MRLTGCRAAELSRSASTPHSEMLVSHAVPDFFGAYSLSHGRNGQRKLGCLRCDA